MDDSQVIDPAQRNPVSPQSESAIWRPINKSLEDYERDRVEKYVQYFQENNT